MQIILNLHFYKSLGKKRSQSDIFQKMKRPKKTKPRCECLVGNVGIILQTNKN
jgi:hypothetical protein